MSSSSSGPSFLWTAEQIRAQVRTPQFAASVVAFVVAEIVIGATSAPVGWHWLAVYGLLLCSTATVSRTAQNFFRGDITSTSADTTSSVVLTLSAFISWVFAKSIQNAAVLGGLFGVTGGWGYAAWYVSFFSGAAVIYVLRTRYGYSSLPEAIYRRYGRGATLAFGFAAMYRLYQEVWSNAKIVGDFYGAYNGADPALCSGPGDNCASFQNWWWASVVSTLIPLTYVFMGGMRSSLASDCAQAALAVLFLVLVLGKIGGLHGGNDALRAFAEQHTSAAPNNAKPLGSASLFAWNPRAASLQPGGVAPAGGDSMRSLAGGLDLLVTGLLQGLLSYPFFDPVLTDRCFLTEPKKMVRSFVVGGAIAGLFIFFFSFIGIYGNMLGACVAAGACPTSDLGTYYATDLGMTEAAMIANLKKGTPQSVAASMGGAWYQLVLIIMMTTSMSTLDSTFTSVAKLAGPDLSGFLSVGRPLSLEAERGELTEKHITVGRVAMVVLAVVGLLPLLGDPSELSATTASGTMVMGIGPPIYMLAFQGNSGKEALAATLAKVRPLAFHMPFWAGALLGLMYQLSGDACCKDDIDLSNLDVGKGKYRKLLGTNIAGALMCQALYWLFSIEWCWGHEDTALDADDDDDNKKVAAAADAPVKRTALDDQLQAVGPSGTTA
jgi:hypothetical protein